MKMGAKQSHPPIVELSQLLQSTNLSAQEILEFYKDFRKSYPKGRLTRANLEQLYKKTYPNGDPKAVVTEIFRVYDTDGDNTIDFREFIVGLSAVRHGDAEDEKLRLAFQLFDIDGNGHISKSEMRDIVRAIYKAQPYGKYDEKVADAVGKLMFEQLDENRDDKITLEEFVDGGRKDPSILRLVQVDLSHKKH